ncbi:MAG: HEAT repeat domain-containing protein [Planctomycetota bacterium]|nr:MAG: HEAT repeat domain-containing protein [Planctomycetota bacterium]
MKANITHFSSLPSLLISIIAFVATLYLPAFLLPPSFHHESTSQPRPPRHPWMQTATVKEILQRCIHLPYHRINALKEFRRRGKIAQKTLYTLLASPSSPLRLRQEALIFLHQLHSPLTEQAALQLLSTRVDRIRHYAIQLLGQWGTKPSLQALFQLLERPKSLREKKLILASIHQIVRGNLLSLDKYSSQDLNALTLYWKNWWNTHKNQTLEKFYLEMLHSPDVRTQQQAVLLLSKIPNASKHFAQIWQNPQYPIPVRLKALKQLAKLGYNHAKSYLQKALHHPSPEIRCGAIPLFAQLAPQNANISPLIQLCQDPNWEVRYEAIQALRNRKFLQNPQPALLKALHDPHRQVRYAAAAALAKYQNPAGASVALQDLHIPHYRRQSIVLLREIFRQNFGLTPFTTPDELALIAKRWEQYLKNHFPQLFPHHQKE